MTEKQFPTYQRTEAIQPGGQVPDFGGVMRQYGANSNLLSEIGARVAQTANQEMATKLGYQAGLKPHGDPILPPITNFDKAYAASYNTQAQATLTNQAEKLFSDADIELGQATRLTPDLIKKTNAQVSAGLGKIADQAPTAIRGGLQSQFASQMIGNNQKYQMKMFGQQRDDQKNNLIAALTLNAKNAQNLAASGNVEAAMDLAEKSKGMAENGHASRLITPEQANVAADTVKQAAINGKYVSDAMHAKDNGKYEEWAANFSKNPDKLPNDEWLAAGSAVNQQIGFIDSMRKQDEQLRLSQFKLNLMKYPNDVTGNQWAELKANVTPLEYANMEIYGFHALQKANQTNGKVNDLIGNWSSTNAYSQASEKDLGTAFSRLSTAYMDRAQKMGLPMTQNEAEMQIAVQAPGPVKTYVDKLSTQLQSLNPQDIEQAGAAIEHIYSANKGNNLEGLDSKAVSKYEKYMGLRNSMPPQEAASEAQKIVYGQTKEQAEVTNQAWANYIKKNKDSGQTDTDFFLKQSGTKGKFVRYPDAYANQIKNTFESYFKNLQGDADTAKKQLQKTIDQTYGYTKVNGVKNDYTLYPIEQTIGMPDDSHGVILNDVADQVSKQFQYTNDKFKEGKSDWYWEVSPRVSIEDVKASTKIPKGFEQSPLAAHGLQERALDKINKDNKVHVTQHYRNGTVKKFDVIVQASPFASKTVDPNNPIIGGYDILLQNKEGTKNPVNLDPMAGIVTYHPDVQKIKANYMALHKLKPTHG